MQIYAVVDTNVIVSALITKDPQSPPNLVTGNQKHYPIRDYIVTPSEMLSILNKQIECFS